MKFTEKQVKQIIKEIIPKNIKKISEVYLNMKNTQKSFTNRKKFSSSQENIYFNNNYNNFISFNNIDKNIFINNKKNNNSIKKNNNLIYYKKIKPGFLSQRRDNEIIDYIQLKMKIKLKSKPITTLQSRDNSKSNSKIDDLSNIDIRKINSYVNFIPNSSNNSITIEGQLINTSKDLIDSKNIKKTSNNNNNKVFNKNKLIKIIDNNESEHSKQSKKIFNEKKLNKEKDKNSINEDTNTEYHQRNNKSTLINNKNLNEEFNISLLTTLKDSSFYINEQLKLAQFIKKYYREKGFYPESHINFYKYGRLLGKGAFGKVNIALHIASGKLVAIKSFNKKKTIIKAFKTKN